MYLQKVKMQIRIRTKMSWIRKTAFDHEMIMLMLFYVEL